MRIIDFEAHFFTKEYVEHLRTRTGMPREIVNDGNLSMWYDNDMSSPRSFAIDDMLSDLGKGRLDTMDKAGISMQVLSSSPPSPQCFEEKEAAIWARKNNDELAKIVKKNPGRYIGLASVAPQNPHQAADELERAVTELGLKGLMMQSHVGNEYWDDTKYWPIFEKAEKLDVPIYLHPDIPPASMLRFFATYGFPLAGPVLGYGIDVQIQTMRLIFSGLFDVYPKLKMLLAHMGEGLPYWLDRMDFNWLKPWAGEKPLTERRPSDYLRTNFTITTSGMCYLPAFMCAYMGLGADRIAFAVDYPYESNEATVKFIREAPICDTDKEKIFHLNAEKLFGLT